MDPTLLTKIQRNLGPGMTGADVTALQQALMAAGYTIPALQNGTAQYGYYGAQTQSAVAAWQQASGIDTAGNPGYFGPHSMAYLSTQGSTAPSQSSSPVSDGTPYFMGNDALVKFSTTEDGMAPGTFFLVNKSDNTIRPVTSQTGLAAIFGSNLNQALNSVVTVSPPSLDGSGMIQGGALANFHVLDSSYGIQNDGSAKPLSTTPQQLQTNYGQPANPDLENTNSTALHNFLTQAEQNPASMGLDQNTINEIANDPLQLAHYVNAMTYGGYAVSDVYADMKRQSLVAGGDTSMQNVQVISPTMSKAQYTATSQGQQASQTAQLQMPGSVGSALAGNLGLAIYKTPDSLYQTPSSFIGQNAQSALPPLESMSQSDLSSAMSKISQAKAAYYDVIQQGLTAKTEQEQALYNYNWNQFKNYTQQNLGIQLSDNALNAYQQIQGLESQYGAMNLEGSGMQNEAVDAYLRRIRTNDSTQRTQSKRDINNAQQAYYTQYATPDQVAQFAKDNPDLAQQWGLVPSSDIKSQLTPQALMAKYPGLSEAQANQYISTVVDANGNYRSNLYNTYMSQQNQAMGQEYNSLATNSTASSANSIDQTMSPYTKDPFVPPAPGSTPAPTVGGIDQTTAQPPPPTSTPTPTYTPPPTQTYPTLNTTAAASTPSYTAPKTTYSAPVAPAPKPATTTSSIPWGALSMNSPTTTTAPKPTSSFSLAPSSTSSFSIANSTPSYTAPKTTTSSSGTGFWGTVGSWFGL